MQQAEVTIKEYSSEKIIGWSLKDKEYLESKHFNSDSKGNLLKDKRIELVDNRIRNNGPWVGIIKINEDKEVHFCTKMKANFFYMLSYLNDINSFKYDPHKLIELEQGKLFFDIIAKIMIEHFEQIRKKGLLKKYVVKEENVKFSKGKLLIKEQIKRNLFNKSRFYCRYDDLTFNNLENQSILYSINLLTHFVKNSKLKTKLKRIENILSDEISLVKINPEQLRNLRYNRLNSYYESILKLSYHVIRKIYAQNVSSNKGIGFNFIVDMNQVYESFLTEMLTEIIDENYNNQYVLISQEKNKNLVIKGKQFTLKPDVLIKYKYKDTNRIKAIIDIKYKLKKDVPNSDFYQMLGYALAYPDAEKKILLYESIDDKNDDFSEVKKGEDVIKVEFYPVKLNETIENQEYSNLEEFKRKVKEVLNELLLEKKILK
jgi:5-methylcytosine-specific restriction enzyme subunit McrC